MAELFLDRTGQEAADTVRLPAARNHNLELRLGATTTCTRAAGFNSELNAGPATDRVRKRRRFAIIKLNGNGFAGCVFGNIFTLTNEYLAIYKQYLYIAPTKNLLVYINE